MVASASGVGVWLCPSALDGESAPFGAAVMASSGVCASLSLPFPVCPASGRYRACLPLDLVARLHVVLCFEFWRPGDLCWSPVRSALRFSISAPQVSACGSLLRSVGWFSFWMEWELPLVEASSGSLGPGRAFFGRLVLPGSRALVAGLPGVISCHTHLLIPTDSKMAATC